MTALDHETDKCLISPYIEVSRDGKAVYLNTSTFGENCQEELIHPVAEDVWMPLFRASKGYEVTAVVGEYNGIFPPGSNDIPAIKTVSLLRLSRSRTLLGYLHEDVIKNNLPHTFDTLSR